MDSPPVSQAPTFSTIPPELRLKIYHDLFHTMTLSYGTISESSSDDTDDDEYPLPVDELSAAEVPDAHQPLPLVVSTIDDIFNVLLTCQLINNEASQLWPSLVAFSFTTTMTFVFFLARINPSILRQIRYVSVKNFPVLTSIPGKGCVTTLEVSNMLPLFPGLQLDLLTVFDCYHDPGVNDGFGDGGTYYLVESLIRSNGWKSLHFYSATTEFLGHGPPTIHANGVRQLGRNYRYPQPVTWQKLLSERDGQASGAFVKIYVARQSRKETDDPFYSADLQICGVEFCQAPLPEDAEDGLPRDETLMAAGACDKEVLLVAKRGDGATYVENSAELIEGLGRLRDETGWEEIKKRRLMTEITDDPCAWL